MARFEIIVDETLSGNLSFQDGSIEQAELIQVVSTDGQKIYWLLNTETLSSIISNNSIQSTFSELSRSKTINEITGTVDNIRNIGGLKDLELSEEFSGVQNFQSHGAIRTKVLTQNIGTQVKRKFNFLRQILSLEGITNNQYIRTQEVTWRTNTDWNNAVSKNYIDITSDEISTDIGVDTFDDQSDGSSLPNPYVVSGSAVMDTSRSWSGGASVYTGGNSSTEAFYNREISFNDSNYPYDLWFGYNESSNQSGGGWGLLNSNDDVIVEMVTGNPQRAFYSGNGPTKIGNPSPEYDAWYSWKVFNIDFQSETFDIEWVDMSGNGNSTQTFTDEPFINSASSVEGVWFGGSKGFDYNASWSVGDSSNQWYDRIWSVPWDASLTTNIKTTKNPTQPNFEQLDYTLNNGSITLTAIGSPGTGDEEQVSQVLDGSTEYDLTWNDSHTDFQVDVSMNSGDRTGTSLPTINQIKLVGLPI